MDIEKLEIYLVEWMYNKVKDAGAQGVVFGLSGGIDSAVVAGLSIQSFPKSSLGIIMPCYSHAKDVVDARRVARHFNLSTKEVPLEDVHDRFLDRLANGENYDPSHPAVINIKPRLRMVALYYYAALKNYLVVGTSNKCELTVGYFTKYGDGGADILPLGDLVKRNVIGLAKNMDIDQDIINKPPSAGLFCGQTDEDDMGITYEILDKYILTGEGSEDACKKIESLKAKAEHKRSMPPIATVSHLFD